MDWEPGYISDIERGRRNAPLRNSVLKIDRVLDVDPSHLIHLAQQNRGKLEIELEKATSSHMRLATLLTLVWDNLSEQDIAEIIANITNHKKNRGTSQEAPR